MSQPNPPPSNRTVLWRAVKQAQPGLSDQEVDALLQRAAKQERSLALKHGLSLDPSARTGEPGPLCVGREPVGGRRGVRPHAGRRDASLEPDLYRITEKDAIGTGTVRERITRNFAAIRVVKLLAKNAPPPQRNKRSSTRLQARTPRPTHRL